MKKLLVLVVLCAACLVIVIQAQAQVYAPNTMYRYYYGPGFYGGYSAYYAAPAYYYPPAYLAQPYYGTRAYYTSPYITGWSSQTYYPWTGGYYYRYRIRPRFGWYY